jgi:hypothetical protein
VYTTVCVFPEGSAYFTVTGVNAASVASDGPVVTVQVTFGVARYLWHGWPRFVNNVVTVLGPHGWG